MNQVNMSNAIQRNILILLSLAEFWDLLSFFGTVAIVVLYTTKVFLFSDQLSYTIYGIYLALLCGLPMVGGLLTDKFFGYYRSIVIGALMLILGNLFLVIQSTTFLYLGLAATICGTSLYKTTCTSLVGTIYQDDSQTKDKAYTFFYAVLNCGAIVGPIIYGIIAKFFGWHACFLFSAIGLSFCLLLIVIKRNYFKNVIHSSTKPNNNIFMYVWLVAVYLTVSFTFFWHKDFGGILIAFFVVSLIIFYRLLHKYTLIERKRLYGVLVLLFFCMFFFAASLQVGSSLTLFLNRFVDRTLFGWKMPTAFFASLDPLFVVLAAPIFTLMWVKFAKTNKDPTASIKLVWGLVIGGIGFLCFWLSAELSIWHYHYLVLMLLLGGYVFIGAGEICLSPAVLSAINSYSPKSIANTMAGTWYLSMAFAGYLGSIIAIGGSYSIRKLAHHVKFIHLSNINAFAHTFLVISIVAIFAAGILFLFSRTINRLINQES